MPTAHGSKGGFYYQTAPTTYMKVMTTTAWSLNYTNELVESREHEETHVKRYSGMRDWSGSVDAIMNVDVNNNPLVTKIVSANTTLADATLSARFILDGGTTPVFTGPCVITDIQVNAPADGMSTVTMNVAANGAMTFAQRT